MSSSPFVVVTSGAESVRSSSAAPSVCGSVAPSSSSASASAAAGSMSLIRALDEVVLLDKRITKKINEATFLGVMSKKSRAIQNADEFSAQCKGDWQSLSDLINRRNRIKSAIIVSNAATMVKVSGETLSVAEVIERKKSLTLQRDLLTRLKAQRESSLRSLETHNSQMEAELSKLLEIHFGKGGNSKTSASDIEDISRPFRESNAARLLDPLAADQRIRELETYIDEFEREAKFTLSEANAMTRIQVA